MGKCKVSNLWFQKTDPNGFKVGSWARKKGEYELFCIVCSSSFSTDHGYCRIVQHAQQKKHQAQAALKLDPLQLTLETRDTNIDSSNVAGPSGVITLLSRKEEAIRAEIIWSLKTVLANHSLYSNSDIKDVFKAMFGDAVPEEFSLSSSKIMYLMTEALGPYFREEMTKEVSNQWYSIGFDETTNEGDKKEMQISIRYWSDIENKVVEKHLRTYFLGSAKAEDLYQKLLASLSEANIPLSKLLMVSCDGPNVNKKVLRLLNETLLEVRAKGLLDVGTCTLHKVHNAFLKGLQEHGNDVSELIILIYYYFDGWPARQEKYTTVQKKLGIPTHSFIKHVSSRWLTLGPAAQRLLEQWNAVKKYFLESTDSNFKQKEIVKFLKIPSMKAEVQFVVESSTFFTSYSKLFQSDSPQIQNLFDEGKELVQKLENKVYASKDKLLPLKELCFNEELTSNLNKLEEKHSLLFRHNVQKHYVASIEYLKKNLKLSDDDNVLKEARCLKVNKIKDPTSHTQIIALGKLLPIPVDLSILSDEWKCLAQEDLSAGDSDFEKCWCHIFSLKNTIGNPKYPVVSSVVKAVMSISHGSAAIERGFSRSGRVLSSDRTNMNERGLNARLNIISGMKRYNNQVQLFPITRELIKLSYNAHQKYVEYLENQKREKEASEKEDIAKKVQHEAMKRRASEAKDLVQLSRSLIQKTAEEEEKRQTADKLLEEAKKRIEEGLKRKNFEDLSLAQGMLHGVKVLRSEATEKAKEINTVVKRIEKKSGKISDYFKKKE